MQKKLKGIEHYEKRFGIIAIEKGYISAQDVIHVLRTQVEEDVQYGGHRLFGQILLEEDILNSGQVEEILQTLFQNRKPPSAR